MPRLNHRKSTKGCTRCKKRRVKCDEEHPECGACQRHGVPCLYRETQPSESTAHRESSESAAALSGLTQDRRDLQAESSLQAHSPEKATIELALLHYFLTETISTFYDPIHVWKTRVPLVGLKFRFVLDALLSLAALDLYRHTYKTYRPHRDAKSRRDADQDLHIDWHANANERERYLVGHTPEEMQHLSYVYFESAIEGQQMALTRQEVNKKYFEPAFMASLTISMIALCSLACPRAHGRGQDLVTHDETLWFSLGQGSREIVRSWNQSMNMNVLRTAGYFEKGIDFSDQVELFHRKHRDTFHALLVWGSDFETITSDEQEGYEKAVSMLGHLYKSVLDNSEPAYISGALIYGFAAKAPPPFPRLVLEGRPRALAIVGHLFAIMRLVEGRLPFLQGIATRQIPAICERLPQAWKRAMEWASSIATRDVNSLEPVPPPPSLESLREAGSCEQAPRSRTAYVRGVHGRIGIS